ncbi:MAG: hypothetical protein KDH09_18425 [Chrysiogenetes bacterium]|nr:hypothetical protein [Chrysiogenetes bacterium]
MAKAAKRADWPLLEYYLDGDTWLWRGSLLGAPATADEFAARMQAAFAETYEYLSEVHPKDAGNIRRLTLVSGDVLEIETGGDDFLLQSKAGFRIHVVGRYRPAGVADLSRIGTHRRGRALFLPIRDKVAWKGAAPRDDLSQGALLYDGLSRVILSALRGDANRQHLSAVLFEKDGSDLMAVATDGHRMSAHRFLGLGGNLDPKTAKALVPLPAVQELVRNGLRRGRDYVSDVFFDLRRAGEPDTYTWSPKSPSEQAWQGMVIADGTEFPVPLLDPDRFPNWCAVLPGAGQLAWQIVLSAQEMGDALQALGQDWKAVFSQANGRAPKAKDLPRSVGGHLSSEGLVLSYEDPRDEDAALEREVSGSAAKGLKGTLPFLVNPKYLKDALATMGGHCVLAGFPSDTGGRDGQHYISKPLVFFDEAGPTETLVMPMWPPR